MIGGIGGTSGNTQFGPFPPFVQQCGGFPPWGQMGALG